MNAIASTTLTRSNPTDPCVWMQAGVVTKKPCGINLQCSACHFDRVMHQVADENRRLKAEGRTLHGKRRKIVSWREKLKAQPPSRRPCVHHMKGRIEFRICTHEYQCSNCDFDQFFDEQYSVHAVVNPVDFLEIGGFKLPQGYYFHPGHTWAKLEEDATVRVGLDDFALRVLGPQHESTSRPTALVQQKFSRENVFCQVPAQTLRLLLYGSDDVGPQQDQAGLDVVLGLNRSHDPLGGPHGVADEHAEDDRQEREAEAPMLHHGLGHGHVGQDGKGKHEEKAAHEPADCFLIP